MIFVLGLNLMLELFGITLNLVNANPKLIPPPQKSKHKFKLLNFFTH